MSDSNIQAQRQELRNIASTQNPSKPRFKMYQLGTKTMRCDCIADEAVKPDCAKCSGSGDVQKPMFVEVRNPSAAVKSILMKASGEKITVTELQQKDAHGNALKSISVEGDKAVFNAHAAYLCTFVPDTNIRVWDAEADLNRMLSEEHDQLPQAAIGPLVDALMKEGRKTEGKG